MSLKDMAELEFLVPAGSPTAASSTGSVATRPYDGQYAHTVGKHFKQLMNDREYKGRRYLRQIVLIITTTSTHQTALQSSLPVSTSPYNTHYIPTNQSTSNQYHQDAVLHHRRFSHPGFRLWHHRSPSPSIPSHSPHLQRHDRNQ